MQKLILVLFAALLLTSCESKKEETPGGQPLERSLGKYVFAELKGSWRLPVLVFHTRMHCRGIGTSGVKVFEISSFNINAAVNSFGTSVVHNATLCSKCFNEKLYEEFKTKGYKDAIN